MREAAPGSPGLGRAARLVPTPCGSTDGCSSTAPWSTRCRSRTLAGPVDRVYVLNVSSELIRRTHRSPLDVLVKAFAISRKQRFELELRSVPESVEVVVLPAPVDDRDLFDFSDPGSYVDEACTSPRARRARCRRGRPPTSGSLRRSWWRRTAG